ncbi:hypothetical protein B9Z55_021611 [Caenorhabditis nigoni]|nr:hypothetical protein B9Z55_021611 [Caenorhabditis nigoni]
MPIRLLSLSVADLQYALECMDIRDLIAFSLCSNQTKNLVRSSNRKIYPITAYVYENDITFHIMEDDDYEEQSIHLLIFDFYIELNGRMEIEVWRKEEFTTSDWIAHFLRIFNDPMIDYLAIVDTSLPYLDTIKQLFPKCIRLAISDKFSREFTKKNRFLEIIFHC